MKRFACRDIIPDCAFVFVGADDQSVLDQVIAHAAADHGLVKPPLALVELVVATTHNYTPTRGERGHLRLVGGEPADRTSGIAQTGPLAAGPEVDEAEHAGAHITAQANGAATSRVVSFATDRFARKAAGVRVAPDPAVVGQQSPVHDTYRHECLLYRGTEEFLGAVVPFVRDGLALDQPVMVAVAQPRLQALRDALGDTGRRVLFADMAELGGNPARIIPAWREFTERHANRPSRGIGEPIWAGRRAAEIVESQFHEALLNISVQPTTPLWLLCPYDVTALTEDVISEARRSHPVVVDAHGSTGSQDFGGAEHVKRLFEFALPEPAGRTIDIAFGPRGYDDVAAQVLAYARSAGLPVQRAAKLAVAIDEIALAGTLSSGAVSIRLWREKAALLCQVDDSEVLVDPMVGRASALGAHRRERGIRLANELCDLTQVRSGAFGTRVRVHSWL